MRGAFELGLGAGLGLPYFSRVPFYLRLIGTTNAAVWFGGGVFFLAGIWPAFSSAKMLQILPPLHAEAAFYVTMKRYFMLQNWCASIALLHLLFETIYSGRPVRRWLVSLVAGLFLIGLLLGMSAGPRLERLHLERYGIRSTPQQRQQAASSLQLWRGIVLVGQVVVVLGCWVYSVNMNASGAAAWLGRAGKYRG